MSDALLKLSEELDKLSSSLRTASIEYGKIYALTSSQRKLMLGGKPATFHVVALSKAGSRYKCWAWSQEASNGRWIREGQWRVPERMLQPATIRPRKKKREDYLEKAQESWDELDAHRADRRQKRRDISQDRYDRAIEWRDGPMVEGQTYYWNAASYGMNSGVFTGDIKNGKAKFSPPEDDLIYFLQKRKRRATWILLDRVFEKRGTRYLRVA